MLNGASFWSLRVVHYEGNSIEIAGYWISVNQHLATSDGLVDPAKIVPGVGLSIIDGWRKDFFGDWHLSLSNGRTVVMVYFDT